MIDEAKALTNEKKIWIYPILGTGFFLFGLFYLFVLFVSISLTYSIFFHILNITVCCIFIYVGFKYIMQKKLESLDRSLIFCLLPTIFILPLLRIMPVVLMNMSTVESYTSFVESGVSALFTIITVFVLAIMVWSIFLIRHLRNISIVFPETDFKKILRISKWLSNLSPGFAHLILGEYRSGYIIYFINYMVQFFLGGFASVFIWNQPIKLICFGEIMLVCFTVWFILSKIDSSYIIECTKSLEKKSSEQTTEEIVSER